MKQFQADLERAIDDARERGVSTQEVDAVASRRLADYYTAKLARQTDAWVKIVVVLGCMLFAGGITAYRIYLVSNGKPVFDTNWYDWVTGLCLLAAVGHFYNVTKLIRELLGKDK